MGIEGINNPAVQQPVQQPVANEAQVQQAVAEIAPLFGSGQSVSVQETRRVENAATVRNLVDIPELDDADAALLAGVSADLEALIALLQAEQDEKAVQATRTRIESLKGQLQAHHEQTMNKVNESIDEIKKQEKSALANKILGWLGAVFAVVVAVALVCTVGGAAAGFAVVGAAIGLAAMTLQETGVTDKIVKAISESIKNDHPEWSKAACDALAQGIMAGIQIALSISCLVGGGFASAGTGLVQVSDAVMKGVRVGMTVANTAMATAGLASSAAATAINYEAAEKQSEVTDMQQLLVQLQTLLDQESDDLKVLIAQLNDALASVIELLESKQETLNSISQQIGA